MKVLLLNLWRVINSKGGTEKVFFDMANALTKLNYNVAAVGFDNNVGSPGFPVLDNVNFINAGEGYILKKPLFYRIKRTLNLSRDKRHLYDEKIFDPQIAVKLQPIIKKENPDIIISFNAEATRILIYNLKVMCPVITMFHYDPDTILSNVSSQTINALNECSCVQVLMPSFVEITKKYINNKIICIPNVVEQHAYINKNRQNIVINVGRMNKKHKRQALLIEAFNKINYNDFEYQLVFYGETNTDLKYFKYCLQLINKYKINDKVKFAGSTNNVFEKLNEASIYVCPSANEGFGLALTEALATGLPAIGYKSCPAVNELIIDGYNGFLCDDGINDLADKLKILMSDAELRKKMGQNAHESMKKFAPEKVWDQWNRLIKEILAEHKAII
mgnify:CR=1 FL=1